MEIICTVSFSVCRRRFFIEIHIKLKIIDGNPSKKSKRQCFRFAATTITTITTTTTAVIITIAEGKTTTTTILTMSKQLCKVIKMLCCDRILNFYPLNSVRIVFICPCVCASVSSCARFLQVFFLHSLCCCLFDFCSLAFTSVSAQKKNALKKLNMRRRKCSSIWSHMLFLVSVASGLVVSEFA